MKKLLLALGSVLAACSSFSSADTPKVEPPVEAGVPDAAPLPQDAGDVPPYAAKVLSDGPVAYWRMDGATNNIVADATGNGHDLLLVGGGHTLDVPGISQHPGDHAIAFDGVNSGATALSSKTFPFADKRAFTMECWAALVQLPDGGNDYYGHILNFSTGSGTNRAGVLLYLSQGTPTIERDEGHTNATYLGGNGPVSDALFHHYVAVYDGMNMSLWIDGSLIRRDASQFDVPPLDTTFAVGFDRPNNLFRFAGSIDEVAVYDKALTDDAIATHFVFRNR